MLELEIGPVAHGGHCVARQTAAGDGAGQVVFVRHTLPGEVVRARVTGKRSKLLFADAVELVQPSPDRVESAWPAAGPGGVGGGELAHVALAAQRRWKAAVVEEQLRRLAHVDRSVTVASLPLPNLPDDGLAYRTRIDLVADGSGRLGMHAHRSNRVIALDGMPLAVAEIAELDLFDRTWPAGSRVEAVAPSTGRPLLLLDGQPYRDKRRHVTEVVRTDSGQDLTYRVAADGFWQVHRSAPEVLVAAVRDAVGEVAGGTVLDLYCGVGLFTLPLAAAVGEQGEVWAVEGDEVAVRNARRNLHDHPQAKLLTGDVAAVINGLDVRPDVVVLDPPRAGAKSAVVRRIAQLAPRRVVYVACDPAALARDLGGFAEQGYALVDVKAFDLFPMTHHVECVAVLERSL